MVIGSESWVCNCPNRAEPGQRWATPPDDLDQFTEAINIVSDGLCGTFAVSSGNTACSGSLAWASDWWSFDNPKSGQHNLTDQTVGVPVQFNEPRGQLVQQFGMRGHQDAEVVWSLHQRSAMRRANSIGPNPSGQRVLLPGDRASSSV